jgi:hypothetical protein
VPGVVVWAGTIPVDDVHPVSGQISWLNLSGNDLNSTFTFTPGQVFRFSTLEFLVDGQGELTPYFPMLV